MPVPGRAGRGAAAGVRPGPAAGRAAEVRRRQGRLQLHRVSLLRSTHNIVYKGQRENLSKGVPKNV